MSEQKQSFMQQLDEWIDGNVITPLLEADPYEPDNTAGGNVSELQTAVETVKKAIRAKVLESYHNGQAAGPRKPARKEPRQ
jgi:hypothetical protein